MALYKLDYYYYYYYCQGLMPNTGNCYHGLHFGAQVSLKNMTDYESCYNCLC